MALNVKYDKDFLANKDSSLNDTLRYYVEASAYLYEFLNKNGFNKSPHCLILEEWLKHFDQGESDITPADFKAMLDLMNGWYGDIPKQYIRDSIRESLKKLAHEQNPNLYAAKYIIWLNAIYWRNDIPWDRGNMEKIFMGILGFIYGPIGQFVFLCQNSINSQFLKEFNRLLQPNDTIISNHFLFYVASYFAFNGYKVDFIPEVEGGKTPDLLVTNHSHKVYIEATANRSDTTKMNISKIVWDSIQEKQSKFYDASYHPGLIAVDLGEQDLTIDRTSIDRSCLYDDEADNHCCAIYRDNEFSVKNYNSAIADLIEYFNQIDKKYSIHYLWIVQSNLLNLNGNGIEWAQRNLMIMSKDSPVLYHVGKNNYLI